ncbi:RNA polymerase sigma factor [Flavivirga eckloniae]|uniref:RNA polymerase sigma-70 factor n=1 Tax=Flavivirga eckloniae TaxID=1803846 RepID=A0A2K9PV40_9FLAO|nr:RNA polymerase sigma-70 factor [Flavivirga eckloniae]AUP80678.1 RNA polymerase sigma-70 factor [Flavivirga eckloniae]
MASKFKNESVLILHLKKGDEEAYIYLVKMYHKPLFVYALSLTDDHAMAQDIVQEVFISLWSNRKKLFIQRSLKNYMYKITYNKFINLYRKKRAISNLERIYMETLNEVVDDDNTELLEKKIELIKKGITQLPKKCKQTFLLNKEEGLTNIEIAEYLDISPKTVEGHLTKAYYLLRRYTGKHFKNILFLTFGAKNMMARLQKS